MFGTPEHMAPEVVRGKPTDATDRYGLGATAAKPDPLHPADTRARLLTIPGIDDRIAFADHVMTMRATEPANRPTAMVEWAEQLETIAKGPTVVVAPKVTPTSRPTPRVAGMIGKPELVHPPRQAPTPKMPTDATELYIPERTRIAMPASAPDRWLSSAPQAMPSAQNPAPPAPVANRPLGSLPPSRPLQYPKPCSPRKQPWLRPPNQTKRQSVAIIPLTGFVIGLIIFGTIAVILARVL